MHQPKVERSALYLIMPMIQELKRLGFANVRFYSYIRWTHSLVVVLYQEMPFKAMTGQALVYPSLSWCEYGFDMAPKFKNKHDVGLNEWAESGMSVHEIATNFVADHLHDQIPGEGCYSNEYYPWLDSVIAACPDQSFPVTEEPIPGGPYVSRKTIEFYRVDEAERDSSISKPPGLSKMIEPYMGKPPAIKVKELSGFQKWNQGRKC